MRVLFRMPANASLSLVYRDGGRWMLADPSEEAPREATRARSVFGYRPRFDIEAGIKACLGQFQAHTDTSKKAVQ